jgi:hypothetical protein
MIDTIIDSLITNKLYSTFDLDIHGAVHNDKAIKTLWFGYPRVDFLEPIFMEFIESLTSEYIYMTKGYNIKKNEVYLKFHKESFVRFIKTNETYISQNGYKHTIEDYYLIGLTIFDENFNWLIHKNPDEADVTFSYDYTEVKNIEMLIKSEWRSL